MVKVDGENLSSEQLLRIFKRKVKECGIVNEIKDRRYHDKKAKKKKTPKKKLPEKKPQSKSII